MRFTNEEVETIVDALAIAYHMTKDNGYHELFYATIRRRRKK